LTQLSETKGAKETEALHNALSVPRTILLGQPINGGSTSETEIRKEHVDESMEASSTVKLTRVEPTGKDEALGRPAV